MFTPAPEELAYLSATKSEYMLTGRGDRGWQCEIRDTATGIVYAEGFASIESAALTNAIADARSKQRPTTASSGSEAELAALRKKLEEAQQENIRLKSEKAKARKPKASEEIVEEPLS